MPALVQELLDAIVAAAKKVTKQGEEIDPFAVGDQLADEGKPTTDDDILEGLAQLRKQKKVQYRERDGLGDYFLLDEAGPANPLDEAKAGWELIVEHPALKKHASARASPQAFLAAFGTSATSVSAGMDTHGITDKGFRGIAMRYAALIKEHAASLAPSNGSSPNVKSIRALFPKLLGGRAGGMAEHVYELFEKAGFGTAQSIADAVKASENTVSLALQKAGVTDEQRILNFATQRQQQHGANGSCVLVCAEVALLMSASPRAAPASAPRAQQTDSATPQSPKSGISLVKAFQAETSLRWVEIVGVGGDALKELGIVGYPALIERYEELPESRRSVELLVANLKLAGTALGDAILEHFSWIRLCHHAVRRSRSDTLVEARAGWGKIARFSEVGDWGIVFPGQVAEQFALVLEKRKYSIRNTLESFAKDERLRELIALHVMSFQTLARELMTSKDTLVAASKGTVDRTIRQPRFQKPAPPPTNPGANGRRKESTMRHAGKGGVKVSESPEAAYEKMTASSVWDKLQAAGVTGLTDFLTRIKEAGSVKQAVAKAGVTHAGKFPMSVEANLELLKQYVEEQGMANQPAADTEPPLKGAEEPVSDAGGTEASTALGRPISEGGHAQAILMEALAAFKKPGLSSISDALKSQLEIETIKVPMLVLVTEFWTQLMPHVEAAQAAWERAVEFGLADDVRQKMADDLMLRIGVHLIALGYELQGKPAEAAQILEV